MPRITTDCHLGVTYQPSWDADLRALFSRMTCACAETATHAEAPMARALFLRVEEMKQHPELAARALGIRPGDAGYLLAGLREDVAKELVLLLSTKRPPKGTTCEREISDE
ncbi:MAG: hypothetical protein GYB53_08595 [Rhodobacteraceae bacterium]|nr:hypothetical protein [Paracoccaceae bacterium]MBR9823467.1 hypothetical protein [Paracoccaceae bacterium]